jgi:hypothetical protein
LTEFTLKRLYITLVWKETRRTKNSRQTSCVIECLPDRGDIMSKDTKVILDRWVFRAVWVVLIVTVVGFVVKLIEVI